MKVHLSGNEPIAAIATPQGAGAIGVVRISGPGSVQLVSALVSLNNSLPLSSLPSQKSALGIFHQNGTKIDQVIVTIFRAPHSYTGEELVEISAHGSPAVLKRILHFLILGGARIAEPGEFSQRAFLNGKMDLSQAEAVADLIRSQTEFSRAMAFSQLEGTLSRELKILKDSLIEILAHIEVEIDHSDDTAIGKTMPHTEMEKKIKVALKKIGVLIQSYEFGKIVRTGVKIAILGKPNVGKSSLMNCFLKNERAIVTHLPGTTRDTIEEGFDLLGMPAVLVDTAGIREKAADRAEELGIERTSKTLEQSDIAVIVLDGSSLLSSEDQQVAEMIKEKKSAVVAINKSDLKQQLDKENVKKIFANLPIISISALQNDGIEKLLQAILQSVISLKQNHTPAIGATVESGAGGDVIITSLRHLHCLMASRKSMEMALNLCIEDGLAECLALEIRDAADSIGEITGEVVTEDILKKIFSEFCIGK